VGRKALSAVGIGLAAVVGLYAVSTLRSDDPVALEAGAPAEDVGPAAAIPDGPPPPLPSDDQAEVDDLLTRGGAGDLFEAGRFYLTSAFQTRQTNPTSSVQWAREAVRLFEASLAIEPNPDVRFALAEASQYDPADPMRPVLELQAVLADDPEHVGATLMMGERRFMIGRVDSARISFERVLALTQAGDPLRARAEEALQALDEVGG
jgi:hypothetical protein